MYSYRVRPNQQFIDIYCENTQGIHLIDTRKKSEDEEGMFKAELRAWVAGIDAEIDQLNSDYIRQQYKNKMLCIANCGYADIYIQPGDYVHNRIERIPAVHYDDEGRSQVDLKGIGEDDD